MTFARSRLLSLALAVPFALAAAAPARAGFFEDLFGIKNPPAATPAPRAPQAPAPKRPKSFGADVERRSAKREIEANLALKAAQAGKDPVLLALQDSTLRRGDIVCGRNGLMVFMGGDPEPPGEARFVPANDPKLEKRLRESLNGLKRPAAAPAPNTQRTSADAAPAEPVSIERDGKLIRVVGSYQAAQ